MGEVTIDSIQIEIESNSTNASKGLDALAGSLEKLKKNGSFKTVSTNLNNLSAALKNLPNVHSASNALRTLANSIEKLKGVGSVSSLTNSLGKLPAALKSVTGINLDRVAPQIQKVADTVAPLSNIKAGGLSSMVSSMKKLGDVTESLDDETIEKFAKKVELLNTKLAPLSEKMSTIKTGFNAINTSAKKATNSVDNFGDGVNATTLNLSSFIHVAQTVIQAVTTIVQKLSEFVHQASQWDGVRYQFGNAFGEQADIYYEKISKITEALMINKQAFMENSAMAASMLIGFGVDKKDAREMGLGYTQLAYDIWAAYNNVYETLDGADGAMAAVRSAIAGEVEPIRRAGFTIVEATLEQTAANHGLDISLQNATEAQKSYLRYLELVDQAQRKGVVGTYAREMQTAEGMMRTFSQQLKSLSQAFGSLFLPILVKVMPYVQAFVEILQEAVFWAASLFGIEIQDIGDTWNDFSAGTGAIDGVTDSAGNATGALEDATKAAKELKNATLGIDELNVISPPTSSSSSAGGGGAGGGAGGGLGAGFEGLDIDSLWDDSIFDSIQSDIDKIKSFLENALIDLTAVISGFALAIGTILVVTGANIPVGLALMAIGAVGLAATIAANWDGMSTQLAKTLTTVTSVIGGFLLTVGAMLAFSGVNVPLGIALMAVGAVSLATAATINWKFLDKDMKNTLANLTSIVGGALLALGALFTFTGVSVGLGIALMVAGAVSLATAVGLNWNSMTNPMRTTIGTLEAIVGSAMLTFGAILALTGANIPLGIGLIAAGAVSIASAVALNWNTLKDSLEKSLGAITAIVSGALLGVGAILALTGVALPLGIALMAAGAVGLIAAAPINWKTLTESIKNVLKEIGIIAGASLLALGLILCLSGVGIPAGIALIAAGAAGMAGGTALNWDTIVDSVQGTIDKIGDAWDGLKGRVSTAWDSVVTWWNDKKEALAAYTPSIGDISAKISSAWETAKTWWKDKKEALASYTPSIGSISTKLSEAWTSAKTWWKDSKGALSTYTPSIGKIWENLKAAWETAKKWWKDNRGSLSTYTPSIGKIWENLKASWNTAKTWWKENKGTMSYTPSIGKIWENLKSSWNTAKTWWKDNKGTMSYTPTIGSIKDKIVSAWNTAKTWWKNNASLSALTTKLNISVPTISVKWATAEAFGKSFKYPTGFSLKFAADGGIFDAGSLIWAGERGAEIVANAGGGKTGVMNVQQMQDAVYEGVYAAMVAAMRGSGEGSGSQVIRVYLDGKEIAASVEKTQRERGASIMGNEVYSY